MSNITLTALLLLLAMSFTGSVFASTPLSQSGVSADLNQVFEEEPKEPAPTDDEPECD